MVTVGFRSPYLAHVRKAICENIDSLIELEQKEMPQKDS